MNKNLDIRKELIRKAIHLPFVLVVVLLEYTSERQAEAILIVLALAYYLFEQMRLKGIQMPIISKLSSLALRENEEKKFAHAPIMLMLGIVLVLELYTTVAATAAIIAVTVGDTMAAIFGTLSMSTRFSWRLLWNKNKTYIGFMANMVSVFLVSLIFFDNVLIALIVGLSSAAIESLELEHVDNLMIPLFVGAMMYLVVL